VSHLTHDQVAPSRCSRVSHKKFEVWVYNGFTGTNCSYVSIVPTTLTKETANAVTWSNAVKVSSVIGIDLSGRTGFNTKTKIKHVFTKKGYLCGTNGQSWPNAQTVFGK